MLMLIVFNGHAVTPKDTDLNTSHVNVNPKTLKAPNCFPEFKYISC